MEEFNDRWNKIIIEVFSRIFLVRNGLVFIEYYENNFVYGFFVWFFFCFKVKILNNFYVNFIENLGKLK